MLKRTGFPADRIQPCRQAPLLPERRNTTVHARCAFEEGEVRLAVQFDVPRGAVALRRKRHARHGQPKVRRRGIGHAARIVYMRPLFKPETDRRSAQGRQFASSRIVFGRTRRLRQFLFERPAAGDGLAQLGARGPPCRRHRLGVQRRYTRRQTRAQESSACRRGTHGHSEGCAESRSSDGPGS